MYRKTETGKGDRKDKNKRKQEKDTKELLFFSYKVRSSSKSMSQETFQPVIRLYELRGEGNVISEVKASTSGIFTLVSKCH